MADNIKTKKIMVTGKWEESNIMAEKNYKRKKTLGQKKIIVRGK
jgi:hypothetical protein